MRTSVGIIRSGATTVIVAAALVLAASSVALAQSPVTGDGAEVQLGFGATYAAVDGTMSTHRGLDLAGEEGAEIVAPLAGEVTFVGRVPGAGGATVLAMSIHTEQGTVTLLPLDRAMISRGTSVAQGAPIATLAVGGDASSSATHLHLGLRSGSLYLDPTSLLTAPVVEEPESPAQPVTVGDPVAVTEGVPGEGAAGAVGGVVSGAAITPGVTVGAGDVVSAQAGVGSAATVPGASGTPVSAGAGSGLVGVDSAVVAGEVAPGVTLAGRGGPVAEGLRVTGVLADAGETLATGAKVARAASSAARDGRLQSTVSRGVKLARRGARTAALLAMGLLCALGALWPLWRAGGLEGLGKVPVSGVGDDVAAVASR